jgi:hypothetical protein
MLYSFGKSCFLCLGFSHIQAFWRSGQDIDLEFCSHWQLLVNAQLLRESWVTLHASWIIWTLLDTLYGGKPAWSTCWEWTWAMRPLCSRNIQFWKETRSVLLNKTYLTPKCRTYDCGIRLSIDTQFCHLIFR